MSATFFIQRLQTFFLYFLHVFYVFNVFFNFYLNVYYIYDLHYPNKAIHDGAMAKTEAFLTETITVTDILIFKNCSETDRLF